MIIDCIITSYMWFFVKKQSVLLSCRFTNGHYLFLRTSRNLFSLRGLVCLFKITSTVALHDSVCLSVFRDLDPGLKAALREFLAARCVNSKLAGSILHHLLEKERSQYVNWLKTLEATFAKNHWPYPHLNIYKLSFLTESRVHIFVVLMRKLEQLLPFMSMIRYSNPSSALSPVENMWNPYIYIPREFNCLVLNLPHNFCGTCT